MPFTWEYRDPQRACKACALRLHPHQASFVVNANSTRVNDVDTDSASRYFNRPLNFSIGGEVRKATASLENVMGGVETVVNDAGAQVNLLQGAMGLLFITVAK